MKMKKIAAAALAAVMVLSMTACGDGEKPNGSGGAAANLSGNGGAAGNLGGNDSEFPFGPDDDDVSEPPKQVSMWDIMPEIDVTDASAFKYEYDSELGGMVVTDYLRESPKVRIPDKLEGEPVVKVDFINCEKQLTQIVMPDSVKEFSLSGTIKKALQYINIPDSMTAIGEYAFSGCTSLTSAYIGNSVTTIDNAFIGCTSLTSVTIPDSVTKIGGRAFWDCTSLTNITIPDSVTEISEKTFTGCTSLTNAVYKGKSYAYGHLGGLYDTINFDESGMIIEDGVLKAVSRDFTEFVIPDSVTVIGEEAFNGCISLASVTIPNSVTKIGNKAFIGCTSLTNITIPNSVTKIVGYAFDGCTSLTSVTIPNSVTEIGYNAFLGCENIQATYKGKTYDYEHIYDLYEATNGY